MARPAERYDRQLQFFGTEGQARLAAASIVVVGIGGLGTHVVQQLALLGVGHLVLVDGQDLAETNRNRYVGVRSTDPVPGFAKVDLGERIVSEIDPRISVSKVADSLVSESAFGAIIGADCAFGCLDSEGARLILTELCSAYKIPYVDLASDIVPGQAIEYGGRVHVNWSGGSCLVCCDLIDSAEAQRDLAGPTGRRDLEAIYGVGHALLNRSGPSVVSLNGVVASLGVTEFMVGITGLRKPQALLTYHGTSGKVTSSTDEPLADCYYCRGIRGLADAADVQRYIRGGLGQFLF